MHLLGKPLSLYYYLFSSSLGAQGSSQGGQLGLSASSQLFDLSGSTPVSGHVSSQPASKGHEVVPPGQHQMVPQDSMTMSGSTLSPLPGESSNSSSPLLVFLSSKLFVLRVILNLSKCLLKSASLPMRLGFVNHTSGNFVEVTLKHMGCHFMLVAIRLAANLNDRLKYFMLYILQIRSLLSIVKLQTSCAYLLSR